MVLSGGEDFGRRSHFCYTFDITQISVIWAWHRYLVRCKRNYVKSLDRLVRAVPEQGRGKIYQAYAKHLVEQESAPEQSPLVKWVRGDDVGSIKSPPKISSVLRR